MHFSPILVKLFRYGLVGSIVTTSYICTFLILCRLFPASRLANSVGAYIFGCFIQYVGNAWFTFERPARSSRQIMRYLMSIVAGLATTNLMLFVLAPAVGLLDGFAALAASILVTMLNFLTMLKWTFVTDEPPSTAPLFDQHETTRK